MNTTTSLTYEQLYNNMVKKFTVEKDNTDYTLGEFMLMKAREKKNAMTAVNNSALPVAHTAKSGALATVFSYVNDKLKVKEAPVRDKTIRSFPLRTSFTAFCSALVVCALVVGCCYLGLTSSVAGNDNTVTNENEAETEKNMETEENTAAIFEFKNI